MLFISVRTAETHRAHIMQKLRLTTRAELVRYALDQGLLELREPWLRPLAEPARPHPAGPRRLPADLPLEHARREHQQEGKAGGECGVWLH